MNTIYTAGFASWTLSQIELFLRQHNAFAVDIRHRAWSARSGFSHDDLLFSLSGYLHVPELGIGAEVLGVPQESHIMDIEKGAALVEYILRHQSVMLLCSCHSLDTCHRSVVAEALQKRLGLIEIEHLQAPSQQRKAA